MGHKDFQTRLYRLLGLILSTLLPALLVAGCPEKKAGLGEFCEKDDDCESPLICREDVNTCINPSSNECIPACQKTIEVCFHRSCKTIMNPADRDGDGFSTAEDCNDEDATIHPGATEFCDGLDNDCDQTTDEGCPTCVDSDSQECGSDLGECTQGTQTCQGAKWTLCSGTRPIPETCDGKDNDCDALVDEVCPCENGTPQACGVKAGICNQGSQLCTDKETWGDCTASQLPQEESCDGLDNDCDGFTDDGFDLGINCVGKGQCGAGVVECADAASTRCSTMPGGSQDESAPESCDEVDNDCDGETDEDLEADQVGNTCTAAQNLSGLPDGGVAGGGGRITVVGNIWPPGDEDWYQVTAVDNVDKDIEESCDRFHFRAGFLQNPGALLQFDVYIGTCEGTGVDCLNEIEYEHAYDSIKNVGGQIFGQCPCHPKAGDASNCDYPPTKEGCAPADINLCTDDTKTFFIRVHAKDSQSYNCQNYELVFSNGIQP